MPSNVLLLCFKLTFPPIIWIFTEDEGDWIWASFKIFSTLYVTRSDDYHILRWYRSVIKKSVKLIFEFFTIIWNEGEKFWSRICGSPKRKLWKKTWHQHDISIIAEERYLGYTYVLYFLNTCNYLWDKTISMPSAISLLRFPVISWSS